MLTLGIVVLWGGYTLGVWGYSKIKSAYGFSPGLTLGNLALPSQRGTYINVARSWSVPTAGTTPGAIAQGNINATNAQALAAQAAQAPGAPGSSVGTGGGNVGSTQPGQVIPSPGQGGVTVPGGGYA